MGCFPPPPPFPQGLTHAQQMFCHQAMAQPQAYFSVLFLLASLHREWMPASLLSSSSVSFLQYLFLSFSSIPPPLWFRASFLLPLPAPLSMHFTVCLELSAALGSSHFEI